MQNTQRLLYLAGFVFIALILTFAVYLEQHDTLYACPLCVTQRIVMCVLAFIFLFGAIIRFKKIGQLIIGWLALLFSASGIALAGRHVFIQHYPTGNGDCAMGLFYLFKIMPMIDVIKTVYAGGVECAKVSWTFLNISLAGWSLVCFIFFFLFSIFQLTRAS